ncbi:hypothetical protein [Chengkuizengella sediminis]|uniref:hypothetical protein n=1 Tax=Chengkuizengella sediminis TaxID=1885917 RepID=UPI001389FE42|nr:hypothetical protein [Chengkuizengella sediminis]NDI35965.1 hypothetical protein [Chengkuizengella sediminis]
MNTIPSLFQTDLRKMAQIKEVEVEKFWKSYQLKEHKSKDILLTVTDDYKMLAYSLYYGLYTNKVVEVVSPALLEKKITSLIERKNINSITLLGMYPTIQNKHLLIVQKVLYQHYFDIDFGFFVPKNSEELVHQLDKSLKCFNSNSTQNVLILNTSKGEFPKSAHLQTFSSQTLNNNELKELVSNPLKTFNMISHGRDNEVLLNDSLLCGKHLDTSLGEFEHHKLPHCAHFGECFYSEELLIKATEVEADVVFLNTCLGFRIGEGNFDQNYLLSASFLKGKTSALIASPFIKNGQSYENILFHYLLSSGESLGKITSLLNKSALINHHDFPQLFLYGDPTLTFKEQDENVREYVELTSLDDNIFACEETCFLSIEITNERIKKALINKELDVFVYNQKQEVYYNIIYLKNKVYIYIYSLYPLKMIELQLKSPLNITSIDQPIQLFENLNNFNINILKCKSLLNEIKSLKKNFSNVSQAAAFCFFYKEKQEITLHKMKELIERCEELLLEHLLKVTKKQRFGFTESYWNNIDLISDYKTSTPCPYCKEPSILIRGTGKVDYQFERNVIMCPVCGIVNDLPKNSSISVKIISEESLSVHSIHTVLVQIINHMPHSCTYLTGLEFVYGKGEGVEVFDQIQQVKCKPNQVKEVKFQVNLSPKTQINQHWLSAYVISNHDIYSAHKNIWTNNLK